jgi:hypothetical protein
MLSRDHAHIRKLSTRSSSLGSFQAQDISDEVAGASLFGLKFGIVRWGVVCSATDIAAAVMPGEFAISSKRGAAASGERRDLFSTE